MARLLAADTSALAPHRIQDVAVADGTAEYLDPLLRKEVFKTHSTRPDPAWGPVTCIHPDVPRLYDGEAMIHALRAVGYQPVGMK